MISRVDNSWGGRSSQGVSRGRWGATTATEASDRFEERRASLDAELGIDIKVIDRDEFTLLLMEHLGRDRAL